jgi:hypothetical protein
MHSQPVILSAAKHLTLQHMSINQTHIKPKEAKPNEKVQIQQEITGAYAYAGDGISNGDEWSGYSAARYGNRIRRRTL